jgi:hypothetical protein
VVGTADPFHSTVDPPAKPDPFTVRVNADPPAVTALGLRFDITGSPGLIVKVTAFEVPAPVEITVIVAVPADAIKLAEIEAFNWLALT